MPSKDISKITGIYEQKLIRKLIQVDSQTKDLFTNYISKVSPILAQYRKNINGVVVKNKTLDAKLQAENESLKAGFEMMVKENQAWAWIAANEKNSEIIGKFIQRLPASKITQKGLFEPNLKALQSFQKRKYDGMQLSDRIWKLVKGNDELLNTYLENGLSIGRSSNQIAQDVQQLLNEPDKLFRRVRDPETGKLKLSKPAKDYGPGQGKYRSSYQNARRLARTEVNMAYRASDHERWKSLDFILGFEVKLSDSHPLPDICNDAAGKYPKEFKFVGWHPNCLCYAIPILPKEDDFIDSLVNDTPVDGHVKDVPQGLKDWVSANEEKIKTWKKQPFFVQDNFKNGRIEKGLLLNQNI